MTTAQQSDLSAPHPDAPSHFLPRLSGRCACCGESETRSLFGMGHDARFRGFLQRALAQGDWTNQVDWFVAPGTAVRVTVRDALAHIKRLIARDWTDKVVAGASRLAHRPVVAPSVRPPAGSSASGPDSAPLPSPESTSFQPVVSADRFVDELMRKLSRPMVGRWGWFTCPDGERRPARVQATRPDLELDPTTWHVDLKVEGELVADVRPELWTHDESAAEAL